jgi:hypothetical protein
MPVFLWLRTRRVAWWRIAAGGFVTGALVPALLLLFGPAAQQASIGGVETVADGHYTAAGWLENAGIVGGFGAAGIAGALLAWLLLGWIAPVSAGRQLNRIRGSVLVLMLAGAVAGSAALPWAMRDRSCHNPMRDGREAIGPAAAFELHVARHDWPALRDELDRFAAASGWSIRADVRTDPDFPWFQASLCTEPGTQIFLQEVPLDGGYVAVDVFQPQGGDSWQPPFHALQARLEARWPGAVRYDDGAYAAPRPPWAPPPAPAAQAQPR